MSVCVCVRGVCCVRLCLTVCWLCVFRLVLRYALRLFLRGSAFGSVWLFGSVWIPLVLRLSPTLMVKKNNRWSVPLIELDSETQTDSFDFCVTHDGDSLDRLKKEKERIVVH